MFFQCLILLRPSQLAQAQRLVTFSLHGYRHYPCKIVNETILILETLNLAKWIKIKITLFGNERKKRMFPSDLEDLEENL